MRNSFSLFQKVAKESLDNYFSEINSLISQNKLWFSPGHACLYPSVVLFTETETHYVLELLGARRGYDKLRVKRHKVASFNQVLASFNFDRRVVYLFSTDNLEKTSLKMSFRGMAMVNVRFFFEMEQRYPGIQSVLHRHAGIVSDLSGWFPDNPRDEAYASLNGECIDHSLVIENCLLSSTSRQAVRFRHTNFLLAVSKRISFEEASAVIRERLTVIYGRQEPLAGIQVVPEGNQEATVLSAQFANLFLQRTKEVTLSQFLEDHADALKVALNSDQIWYQAQLPWKEGNPNSHDKFIQPDMITRRRDGVWQLIELKLPLLAQENITRGGHRRRRFIESPYEGISQLANYAEYFKYSANLDAAEQVLGRRVTSSPACILIVGNADNVDDAEIAEAKRGHFPVDIMSFDTLTKLLAGANGEVMPIPGKVEN